MRQDDIEAGAVSARFPTQEIQKMKGRLGSSIWGKCNAGQASLQATMSAKSLSRLINIRTNFVRTFGQPVGSCG
jgi:hypothetical protein